MYLAHYGKKGRHNVQGGVSQPLSPNAWNGGGRFAKEESD